MAWLAELSTLQWRWPAVLGLLGVPLFWWAWTRRRERLVRAYADESLQPWALVPGGGARPGRRGPALGALAWCLLAVSLAGPRWPTRVAPGAEPAAMQPAHALDIIVVLDRSASMREADVAPDRATRARLKLADLLPRLRGERLGLVLLTTEPGLVLPLTRDTAVFDDMLRLVTLTVTPGVAPSGSLGGQGADFAAALRVAESALRDSHPAGRAVLLVTDAEAGDLAGETGAALRARLGALAAARLPVYVWAISDAAAAPADPRRRPAHPAWAAAVRPTGGVLVAVGAGHADVDALFDGALARLPGAPLVPGPDERVTGWREAFQAPLAIGLALWVLASLRLPARAPRERSARSRRFLAWLLVWPLALQGAASPVDAGAQVASAPHAADAEVPEVRREAWVAWQAGRWSDAQSLYARLGSANDMLAASAAAIRGGDGAAASLRAGQALWLAHDPQRRLDALNNLGHAFALLSRWDVAAEAWTAVLAERPDDARAASNLAVAKAELARRARRVGGPADLRGRRGLTLEGLASTDGSDERDPPDMPAPQGPVGSTPAAPEAELAEDADGSAPAMAAPDLRQLASGLAKLSRLVDARAELLRGLIGQDRDARAGKGLSPW